VLPFSEIQNSASFPEIEPVIIDLPTPVSHRRPPASCHVSTGGV